MNIHCKKLILRAIEPADHKLLFDLINDSETEFLLGGWSFPVSSQKQADWIAGLNNETSTLRCIMESIEDKISVGTIILSDIDLKNGNAEIHLKISKDGQRGKGYGFDAISGMVKYAFDELRLKCIYARILEYNEPSIKLFLKCGFNQEGILRKRSYKRGNYYDMHIFSIINKRGC